jgi:uncharacterized protein YkwD
MKRRFVIAGLIAASALGRQASASPCEVNTTEFRWRVNAVRRRHDLRPLRQSPLLEHAACAHATAMARRGVLAHEGEGGTTPFQRAVAAGYMAQWLGENLAVGQFTETQVLDDWMNSPPHRHILLHTSASEFGIAATIDLAARRWWALLLAHPLRS